MENITNQIKGLLIYINKQTDNNFDRLSDAIRWIVDEYIKLKNK